MLNKLSVILLGASSVLTSPICAQEIQVQRGYTITIPAGKAFDLVNPFFTISGTCTISMDPAQSILMTGTIIKPTITFDKIEYNTVGQSVSRTIHNGDIFELGAGYKAALRLKNEGNYEMQANCRVTSTQ